MNSFDVIIVGGGPAGSMTGGLLARGGRSVCILEREEFPRFHIGESMLAHSLGVLRRAGVLERVVEAGFTRKGGAVFLAHDESRSARYDFADGLPKSEFPHAYQVDRASFDALLLRWARDQGVEVRTSADAAAVKGREGGATASVRWKGLSGNDFVTPRPSEPAECRSHSRTDPQDARLHGRFVVDAAGLDSGSARLRGWSREPLVKDRVGVFGHFRLARPAVEGVAVAVPGDILIIEDPTAWAWCIPLRDDVTSVGFVIPAPLYMDLAGTAPEEKFASMAARFPAVRDRVADAQSLGPIRGARSYGRASNHLHEDGIVLAGDAAGFLDPVFSSGICLALDGAETLAGALERALVDPSCEAEALAAYEARVRLGMRSMAPFVEHWYAGTLKRIFYAERHQLKVKAHITSLLAGELWNEENPLVRDGARYISSLGGLLTA